jgi:3-mercaptopyruvate sulfurtransferase SseA
MRLRISFLAVGLCAAITLLACSGTDKTAQTPSTTPPNSAPVASPNAGAKTVEPPTVHADGARRLTTVELHDLLAKGEAFVVDVRNEASYNAGHIPGAKLIPATEVLQHVNELPRNKLIVTYCS